MQKLDELLFAIDYFDGLCNHDLCVGELAIIYSVLPELIHGLMDGNLTIEVLYCGEQRRLLFMLVSPLVGKPKRICRYRIS